MKRYCLVIELNEEHVEDYVDIHQNAWPEMLEAIKNAGAKEELLYIYKNLSIVFFECENLGDLFEKLGKEPIVDKWNATVTPWFKNEPVTLEKIFDLNQQLQGKLEQG